MDEIVVAMPSSFSLTTLDQEEMLPLETYTRKLHLRGDDDSV